MFAQLLGVHGVHDDTTEPEWLAAAWGHRLLREFPKRIPVLLRGFGSNPQRSFVLRIIGRDKNPSFGFHNQHTIAGFEPKAVGHVLGQRGTYGTASLPKRDFFRHGRTVAY